MGYGLINVAGPGQAWAESIQKLTCEHVYLQRPLSLRAVLVACW